MKPMLRAVTVLALVHVGAGCRDVPTDGTPEGALELFLAAMDESEIDPRARADAYALLAESSRERLAERAERATALARRRFEPWEMMAEGRYRRRFTPRSGDGITAEVHGDRAEVVVRGADGQIARVPMVREHGHWRVELAIPEMQHHTAGPRPPPEPRTETRR